MRKTLIGIFVGAVIVLAFLMWRENSANAQLERELSMLQRDIEQQRVNSATRTTSLARVAPTVDPAELQLEDEILAAAEYAVPLNPEQKQRVHFDTVIRMGELDQSYAPLFRQLRLPPEMLDAFKTLIVERNQAIYDAKQLAKEEGFVPATLAEENEIASSVVSEIDSRISALIGADHFAAYRDYDDLSPFRNLVGYALSIPASIYNTGESDVMIGEIARMVRSSDPELPKRNFQRSMWPAALSPDAITKVTAEFGEDVGGKLRAALDDSRAYDRMVEISRDAALAGKLRLDKKSAKLYEAARARLESKASP